MFRWHSGDMVGNSKGIRTSKILAVSFVLTFRFPDGDLNREHTAQILMKNCTMEAEGFKTSASFLDLASIP